ncbi:ornithine cyclodeaminase family protein [Chelativorans sp. AA-79]|uniref:ornithine cyclodeaminase family protein n=1 Tax=Chelativorans sp. AA-79 TaxID=3028735 RepID=UPI0023F8AA11|nr:ornithine cyclodeaminase family protein [Chelativorans sp. AA-79]WEX10658.1 hypothetical protein PVE73_06840 [Chelativorans sp. AA-79]
MTLLLDNPEIAPLLKARAVIDVLDEAYRSHATGATASPPRIDLQGKQAANGETYQLGIAAGLATRYAAIRIKSDVVYQRIVAGMSRKEKYCVEPGKFMGLILLFDARTGELLAILHDGLIQKLRVGADSALGVRYLAREDAGVLGILGAGGMARAHIEAIAAVRQLEDLRIYSPTPANREGLAAEIRDRFGLKARAVDAAEQVYRGAGILCACTSAIGPVVLGRLLEPGMHVTAIGGTLDEEANARISLALRFGNATVPAELPDLDYREECLSFAAGGQKVVHGGTRRFADPSPGARIGLADLLAGRGRTSPDEITFSERGNIHGIQFAAVAGLVYEQALAMEVGRSLPGELFLEDIRN